MAFALAVACSVALGTTSPALAGGGPPIPRIYDCYGFATIVPTYVSALQLKSKSVYLVAPIRQGNHLSGRAARGTYKLRGGKVTFRTGPYARIHWYGKWVLRRSYAGSSTDQAHISLFNPQHQEVLECYPH